ncbi:MAG: beta-N-acetylhexosaminidase [Turneriella sp.]|nr:beta-N-acetylhexosaminidase [Turneriella sp.]
MRKTKLITGIIVALVAGVSGYLGYTKIYLPKKFEQLTEKIIQNAVAALDAEKLAGQAIHIAIPGTELNEQSRKIITELKPGGIIFFGFNLASAEQIKKLTGDLQKLAAELGLPPFLISTDQEGGYVKRVQDGVLQTPPARNLGDTGDKELCRATGYHVSRDLGALGINVFFAPIVDINNNPKNPVIGLRSFGTTIAAVLTCALPFEQGARSAFQAAGGAMPVIKHFPGHGDTHVDSHWALPVIDKKLEALREFELVPFRDAIHSGAPAVMTAHILYPEVDKDAPATLSAKWLTGVLRGELKFRGLVFTDAMEMSAVAKHYGDLNPPVAALKAGADVLLYTSWQEEPIEGVKRIAAEFGALPRANAEKKTEASALERAARNQLRAKLPYLKIENYLPGDEAAWYRDYDKALQTKRTQQPVAHDPETLKKKYADIRWSAKQKRNQPQWLAGQKNQAN